MTNQKFIKYTPLDVNGKQSDSNCELKLNILETSGNYLLHKDFLRHYSSQKQGTVSTKTRQEVRQTWERRVIQETSSKTLRFIVLCRAGHIAG